MFIFLSFWWGGLIIEVILVVRFIVLILVRFVGVSGCLVSLNVIGFIDWFWFYIWLMVVVFLVFRGNVLKMVMVVFIMIVERLEYLIFIRVGSRGVLFFIVFVMLYFIIIRLVLFLNVIRVCVFFMLGFFVGLMF